MNASKDAAPIRVVLLDIEGTTTPIAFVHETLFGYARQHLVPWLERHADSIDARDLTGRLAIEHRQDVDHATKVPTWDTSTPEAMRRSVATYALWLMDKDRKSPGLKALQGLIWEDGYQSGELRGVVFDDVPRALARWHAQGIAVAIYSSGSVLAQRRLFESTRHGDLTPLISGFFDTAVGPKTDAASYGRIVAALRRPAADILFVSDVTRELRAANVVGLATRLAVRPGNTPSVDAGDFEAVSSFDEILPGEAGIHAS